LLKKTLLLLRLYFSCVCLLTPSGSCIEAGTEEDEEAKEGGKEEEGGVGREERGKAEAETEDREIPRADIEPDG
jgi:hypothetical protein